MHLEEWNSDACLHIILARVCVLVCVPRACVCFGACVPAPTRARPFRPAVERVRLGSQAFQSATTFNANIEEV